MLGSLEKITSEAAQPLAESSREEVKFALAELGAVRTLLVDRIWLGIAIVVVIGVPISLSRSHVTGWLPLYSAHIVIGLIALAVFSIRRRLTVRAKAAMIFGTFWAVGIAGLLQLGPFGAGVWWLSITPFVASALFSIRAGLWSMCAVAGVISVCGWAFGTGILSTGIDAAMYESSPQAWATLAIGACLMPMIVFHAISLLTRQVIELAVRQHRYEIELRDNRDKLAELAFKDELTGASSRRILLDRLSQKLRASNRSNQKSALFALDLNGFKPLNDTYGHAAGDEALKAIVHRITALVRPSDTVARFGGDEFIVLLDQTNDIDEAVLIARRIAEAISQPIHFEDNELELTASIGVVLVPDHGGSAEQLLAHADEAMYQAKKQSKAAEAPSVRVSSVRLLPVREQLPGGRIVAYES